MKLLILTFLFMTAQAQEIRAEESIHCVDSTGTWTVQFGLNKNLVSNLTFTHRGQVVSAYTETLTAQTTRWIRQTIYELNLGGIAYFDFYRYRQNPEFEGAFLLTQNPVGFETNVICTAQ